MNWEQHYRQLGRAYSTEYGSGSGIAVAGFFDDTWRVLSTPIEEQVADFALAKDDLLAANAYMHQTPAKTAKAASLLSDWARWWDSTGNPDNYTVQIPPAVWDEARNRKGAFNLANTTSKAEEQHVLETMTKGMSTEQMRGLPDRRDPITGSYYVPPPPPEPLLPPWVKPVALGAAALGLGLSFVPMLRKFILHV